MIELGGGILVVDDVQANLKLLAGMLAEKGYRVRPAASGRVALKAARHEIPDLVLLDIEMPEMDGFEVCRQLKADPDLEEVPVIFLSARTEAADKVRAFTSGGVDYVTKPFNLEEVLARVHTHLSIRRFQTELRQKNDDLAAALDDLRQAQVRLVQSEKMASLGVLTAGIAHELNNPINYVSSGIRGLTGLLEILRDVLDQYAAVDPANAPEELQRVEQAKRDAGYEEILTGVVELIDSIQLGARRTAEIVGGLRNFSGRDQGTKVPTDIHECIEGALVLLHNRVKNDVELGREFGDLPLVSGYPGKLNQLFINMLANAIDAALAPDATEARILVRTCALDLPEGPAVRIEILDWGPGIPADVLPHLFEPFYTTKEVGAGTGLGLATSHGIVTDHGGHISAGNHGDGGALLKVLLPVHDGVDLA